MADSLADIEEINLIEEIIENIAALQPPRVALTERNNVFLSLNDEEFLARFRLSKDSVKFILNEIHFPEFHDGRGWCRCVCWWEMCVIFDVFVDIVDICARMYTCTSTQTDTNKHAHTNRHTLTYSLCVILTVMDIILM